MKVLLFILFSLIAGEKVFSITPEKLFKTDGNKTFYIEHEHKYDWFQSFAICTRMNMALAAFDSKIKWDDVLNMINKQFGRKLLLWTSGYAVGEQREFIWMTTGEEFTFTNWTTGNPDFSQKSEYCVQIGSGPYSEWNDNTCSKKFGFICEYKKQECNNESDRIENPKYQLIFNNYQKS
ncbi:lectin subunit alpha-like [Cochliomyia hominivorax]